MKTLIVLTIFLFTLISDSYPQSWEEINIKGDEYFNKGDFKNALICRKEGVSQAEKEFGKSDINYATAINNLAIAYDNLGIYGKAEQLYIEACDLYKNILGVEHPYFAISLYNLALLYYSLGQYDKAEQMYEDAMSIFEAAYLSRINEYYATASVGLAKLYAVTDRYDSAEKLYIEAQKIYRETIGEKNLYYTSLLIDMADLYQKKGQYEKSISICNDALKIEKERIGDKHPQYASILDCLAVIYFYSGQYEKAIPLYKTAMKIIKDNLGDNHPHYTETLINLAGLYFTINENEKAEPLFITANKNYLDKMRKIFPYLSEDQINKFLNDIYYNFNLFYSFAVNRYKEKPDISSDMLDIRIESKGLILNSTVQKFNKIKNSGDDFLLKKYQRLIELKATYIKYLDFTAEEREKDKENFEKLEIEIEELEKELGELAGKTDFENINWKDIKKSLNPEEAAIEFIDFKLYDKKWTDTIYYYALIVKRDLDNPILVKLFKLDDVKDILSVLSESPGSYVKNSEASQKLYSLVWQPLEKHLQGVTNIYISPTGVLNKVSFLSLKVSDDQLLIDKYKIKYIGNLKEISTINVKENKKPLLTAAVFGGALFDMDSTAIVSEVNKYNRGEQGNSPDFSEVLKKENETTRGGKWGYLQGTLKEAEFIENLLEKGGYNVTLYSGESATEEAFKSLSGKNSPSILHISTHGFFFPEPKKDFDKTEINNLRG